MQNVMTTIQNNVTETLIKVNERLKYYAGDMPYGMKKATPKEQRDMFENLDAKGLSDLINQYGADEVNEMLGKFMQGRF